MNHKDKALHKYAIGLAYKTETLVILLINRLLDALGTLLYASFLKVLSFKFTEGKHKMIFHHPSLIKKTSMDNFPLQFSEAISVLDDSDSTISFMLQWD